MDIKERILEFIKSIGVTNAEFERVCGLSNGFVNSVSNKVRKSSLNMIFMAYPQLNEDWLINGQGMMLKPDIEKATDLKALLASINKLVSINERLSAENERLIKENATLKATVDSLSSIIEKSSLGDQQEQP